VTMIIKTMTATMESMNENRTVMQNTCMSESGVLMNEYAYSCIDALSLVLASQWTVNVCRHSIHPDAALPVKAREE